MVECCSSSDDEQDERLLGWQEGSAVSPRSRQGRGGSPEADGANALVRTATTESLQTAAFASSFGSTNMFAQSFVPSASSFHMSYYNSSGSAYSISDFRRCGSFKAHKQIVTCMILLGNRLVSACADSSIKVWDVGPLGDKCRLLKIINDHEKGVTALAECDGKLVSCSANDRSVRVFDPARSWKQIHWISDHTTSFHSLLGIQGVLCAGSYGGSIKVYDPASRWDCCHTLSPAHEAEVISMAEVHALLATGSNDRTIKLWDPGRGWSQVAELTGGHSAPVPRLLCFRFQGEEGEQTYLVSCP
jgi:WD40 repeat protein